MLVASLGQLVVEVVDFVLVVDPWAWAVVVATIVER